MSVIILNKLFHQPACLLQLQPSLYRHCENLFMHSSPLSLAWAKDSQPKKWLQYNNKVYPPQTSDEEPRPAVSC